MSEPDAPPNLKDIFNMAFNTAIPHNRALGIRFESAEKGTVIARLPYDEKLVGNPTTGVLHGGAITSLMDATAGAAVFSMLLARIRIATLDLRIDYLRPATPGQDVLATAECIKVTKRVAFVRATASHGDESDLIALASGSFMIFRDETMLGRKKKEGEP